jgi:hypothetical protein
VYDINRPLRRLEIAQRIQELRDKANAEHLASDASTDAVVASAAVDPVPVAATPVAPTPVAPTPVAPVQPPRDVAPELPVQRVHGEGAVPPAVELPVFDGTTEGMADDSAAATIASLLRGGQTWLLNPDERQHRESQ